MLKDWLSKDLPDLAICDLFPPGDFYLIVITPNQQWMWILRQGMSVETPFHKVLAPSGRMASCIIHQAYCKVKMWLLCLTKNKDFKKVTAEHEAWGLGDCLGHVSLWGVLYNRCAGTVGILEVFEDPGLPTWPLLVPSPFMADEGPTAEGTEIICCFWPSPGNRHPLGRCSRSHFHIPALSFIQSPTKSTQRETLKIQDI